MRGTSGQLLGGGGRGGCTGGMTRSTPDPHPVRWMRYVEVLLWTTSSGKRLRLGGGRRRVWGFTGFVASMYEWLADGMGVGNHGLQTCLSEMWGKL